MKSPAFCLNVALSIMLLIVSAKASAQGDIVENGGNVLWCDADSEKQTVLLDFYEMRFFGLDQRNFDASLTPTRLAQQMIEPLRKLSPARHERWSRLIANILEESGATFVPLSGTRLVSSDDARPVDVPVGCEIRQVFKRRPHIVTGQNQYIIDWDTWSALDRITQAGLLLHEAIYGESVDLFHHKVSARSRFLTGYITSVDITSAVLRDWAGIMRIAQVDYLEDGELVYVLFPPRFATSWDGLPDCSIGPRDLNLNIAVDVVFSADGTSVREGLLACAREIAGQLPVFLRESNPSVKAIKLRFDEAGDLAAFSTKKTLRLPTLTLGSVEFLPDSMWRLAPDGGIASTAPIAFNGARIVELASENSIVKCDAALTPQLELAESGRVTNWSPASACWEE